MTQHWPSGVYYPTQQNLASTQPQAYPVPSRNQFYVGDHVSVLWNGKYYPSTVLNTNGNQYYIHYDGYSNTYDEWVDLSRIGYTGIQPPPPVTIQPAPAPQPLPLANQPLKSRLKIGGQVEVLWKGTWYPSTIKQVGAKGAKYYIHYNGYGNSWDEWVGLTRIR